MSDLPFVRARLSPALDRWADFPTTRPRTGVRLARPSHVLVPTIITPGKIPANSKDRNNPAEYKDVSNNEVNP